MKKLPRIKRFLLLTCLLFIIDEYVIQRTHSMGLEVLAAPIVYEVAVATAAAASAVVGAYVISQLPRDTLSIHSNVLPEIHDQLQNTFPQQHTVSSNQAVDPTQAIEQTILSQSLQSSQHHRLTVAQEQAIIEHVQQKIVQPSIQKTLHFTTQPTIATNIPTSSIHISYQPNKIRIDFDNMNMYIAARFSHGEGSTPLQQQLIVQDKDRAMEAAITQHLIETNPDYRNDLANRLSTVVDIFKKINSDNALDRANARFLLLGLSLEEPFATTLQEIQNGLIPFYFDKQGALVAIDSNECDDIQFLIAKLLKQSLNPRAYNRLLRKFELYKVIEYEDSFGIVDNFWYVVTGKWFPNRYPHDIKKRICNHSTNKKIWRLIKTCEKHDFIQAQSIVTNYSNNHVIRAIYEDAYKAFCKEHCNEYGIFSEYASDPLWAEKTSHAKREISKNIKSVTAFNTALQVRAIEKKAVQKKWHIADCAPPHVHTSLFHTLDLIGTGTPFVAKVMELAEQYENEKRTQFHNAFFLQNGVLKDFAHFNYVQEIHVPPQIFAPKNRKVLQQLNDLVYINSVSKNKGITTCTANALAYFENLDDDQFILNTPKIEAWHTAICNGTYQEFLTQKQQEEKLVRFLANFGHILFKDQDKQKEKLVPLSTDSDLEEKKRGGGKPPQDDENEDDKNDKPKSDKITADKIKEIVKKLLNEENLNDRLGPGGPKLPADKILKEVTRLLQEQFRSLGLELPTKKFIKHTLTKHFPNGPQFLDRLLNLGAPTSFFLPKEKFVELALEAWAKGHTIADKVGTKIYDFGRIIGYDKQGNPTTCVKVAVNQASKTITSAYPISGN